MHPFTSFHVAPTPQYVGAPRGKTYQVVFHTRERSSLRPKNPETPKGSASVLKNMVTYSPQPIHFGNGFFSQIRGSIHIPPPKGTIFSCITPKVEKDLKKCEFAPCWHVLNVQERYNVDLGQCVVHR